MVPAGLDGNPDPLVTPARTEILEYVARLALAATTTGSVLVGVDGASGTGKSTFADELARTLDHSGRAVVRASIDSFHNPRAVRYRLRNDPPEGYYRDSHDLRALESELLRPFTEGGSQSRTAMFDEPTDRAIAPMRQPVSPHAVLVFDGCSCIGRDLSAAGTSACSCWPRRGARRRDSRGSNVTSRRVAPSARRNSLVASPPLVGTATPPARRSTKPKPHLAGGPTSSSKTTIWRRR
jgi:ABC-type dipeptide/oligopeptide/nickel transport system ATPase component